ncbi:hypothetical protein PR003_g29732 [Phytophthora rubi]|uniref:Reverse transcriptase Ty1/copia-type domain-containing protein n=2 Tax=Phytophthora rubi TaxID=129364 RepID=A0A6A4BJK1_9STRA|nr:hypothetical protein PR002_g28611 [Phytophthora rubi]KAE9274020.1 hypothetical protein PR003_g29732 [Phytophthora rubi]
MLGISTTQKGYRLLLPRTKRFITSPDVQNIDKLDIQDPLTAEVLLELHDEHSDASATSTDTPVRATEQEGTLECNDQSEEDDEAEVPDDFGRPIPTGVPPRVFGRREHSEPTDFELPQSFIDAFAGPAYAMMTIKAADHEKEPQLVAEAKRSKHWSEWKAAMDKELAELDANGTWELVEAPDGANIVTSKRVYKMKFSSNGELGRFKARLVARGFTQRYGIDVESTYSPVLRISSLRFIVMLAAIWKVKLRQGDVPNAYLKSALDKPIYLRPPTGTTGTNDHRVWLLLKGLYGLKQSGKL